MENNKIIERVKKLLALANSSNENESESAMLKAQELMAKHKLQMKDISIEEKSKVIDEESNFEYTVKTQWKGNLALNIAENFGCHAYIEFYNIGRRRKINLCFIGEEDNVEMTKVVYEYALKVCEERIKNIQKEYKKNNLSTRGIQQNYGLGFARGLKEQYKEQLRKNQDWGIIVVKSKEVMEAIDNKNFKKNNSKVKYERNEHYESGYSDGKKFNTQTVLA